MSPSAMEQQERDRLHVEPWLSDYVSDSLELRELAAVEAHMLVCERCFCAVILLRFEQFKRAGDASRENSPTRSA